MDTASQPKWGDKELFSACFSQKPHTDWLWGHMGIGHLWQLSQTDKCACGLWAVCTEADPISHDVVMCS